MKPRALLKRSKTLNCLYYLLDDWCARHRLKRGNLGTFSGTRHATLPVEASLDYIDQVYTDYLAYAGLDNFSGTVAEIGPGDNFGFALRCLWEGADVVHTIDRYRPRHDPSHHAQIYQALAARQGVDVSTLGDVRGAVFEGLEKHVGVPAELFFRSSDLRFNAIVSRAALEHLYDPIRALDDMVAALAPGGILIHRIDLRDHGMFSGHHPLTFLTIPDRLYRAMTISSGRPNRVLVSSYKSWLAGSGLDGTITVSRLVGADSQLDPVLWEALPDENRKAAVAQVRRIRARLIPRFRAMLDIDLAVSGCVLVARQRS